MSRTAMSKVKIRGETPLKKNIKNKSMGVLKMKFTDKNKLFVRIEPDLHKMLKLYCVYKEISVQDFLCELIKEGIKKI